MSVKKTKSTPILKNNNELQQNQIRSKSDFIVFQRSRPNLIVPQPRKKFPSQLSPTDKIEIDFSKEIDELVSPIYKTTYPKTTTLKNFDNFDLGMEMEMGIETSGKESMSEEKEDRSLQKSIVQEEGGKQQEEEEEEETSIQKNSSFGVLEQPSIDNKPNLPFSPPIRSKCPIHHNNKFFNNTHPNHN
ncbi:hypothetical protein M0813_29979 [Anaeramoeba flamelloides]|uniref:Uncharacterized protein n=1 Tax=Anaeramoeba flamelloides TaxID=1746091 RepID=A0ABQ8XMB9_9EUKA|nr:hypothetical protein M0813_29979 [Anaeramoeba flamelloides]